MKTFVEFINEQIKDVSKMPVIGHLITSEFKWGDTIIPSATYNVVEIIDGNRGLIYITDKWYKSGVPQIIHSNLVKEYTPLKISEQ
jgi:hypothetical protein